MLSDHNSDFDHDDFLTAENIGSAVKSEVRDLDFSVTLTVN